MNKLFSINSLSMVEEYYHQRIRECLEKALEKICPKAILRHCDFHKREGDVAKKICDAIWKLSRYQADVELLRKSLQETRERNNFNEKLWLRNLPCDSKEIIKQQQSDMEELHKTFDMLDHAKEKYWHFVRENMQFGISDEMELSYRRGSHCISFLLIIFDSVEEDLHSLKSILRNIFNSQFPQRQKKCHRHDKMPRLSLRKHCCHRNGVCSEGQHDLHRNCRAHYCQCRYCQNTMQSEYVMTCRPRLNDRCEHLAVVEKDQSIDEFFDIFLQHYSVDKTLVLLGSTVMKRCFRLKAFPNCTPLFGVRVSEKGPHTLWPCQLPHGKELFCQELILPGTRGSSSLKDEISPSLVFFFMYLHCAFVTLIQFVSLYLDILTDGGNAVGERRSIEFAKPDNRSGDGEKKSPPLLTHAMLALYFIINSTTPILRVHYGYKSKMDKARKTSLPIKYILATATSPLPQDEVTKDKLYNVITDSIGKKGLKSLYSLHHSLDHAIRNVVAYPAFTQTGGNRLDNILERFSTSSPPNRRETMSFEFLRLCTLHDFPCRNSPSLVRLTQAGFYYEGNDDEVICFACHIRRRNWQATDDPMVIHRQMSPDCPFLRNEAGNIPVSYAADSVEGSQTASTISHGRDLQTDNASVLVSSQGSVPKDSATGSVVRDCGTLQGSVAADCGTIQSPVVRESGNVPGSVISQSQTVQGGNMATSQNTQPRYTMDAASAAVPAAIATPHSRNRTAGSYQAPRTARKPKYPEYANRPTRLESYRNWPPEMTQNPLDMTEAGFFFTGNGDCARCFHCGIGLKNWDPLDNPWVEHARWSQSCPYLLEIKGQDFIDLVMDAAERAEQDDESPAAPSNSQPLDPDSAPRSSTDSGRTDSSSVTTASARDNSQVPKFPLQAPAPQSVISQGYSPKIVKQAMDKIIERTGWVSVTTEAILKEITDSGYATASTASAGASASSGDGNVNQEYKVPKDKTVLRKENKELKELTTCKICLDAEVTIVFLPCGHLVSCAQCSPAMRKCPICRTLVKGTVKTNLMEG